MTLRCWQREICRTSDYADIFPEILASSYFGNAPDAVFILREAKGELQIGARLSSIRSGGIHRCDVDGITREIEAGHSRDDSAGLTPTNVSAHRANTEQ
jgi:hypothetical protein